jgi:hypothetical protein
MIRCDALPVRHKDGALDKKSTSYNDTFDTSGLL